MCFVLSYLLLIMLLFLIKTLIFVLTIGRRALITKSRMAQLSPYTPSKYNEGEVTDSGWDQEEIIGQENTS